MYVIVTNGIIINFFNSLPAYERSSTTRTSQSNLLGSHERFAYTAYMRTYDLLTHHGDEWHY